jgi:lipoprotein NlpD
LRLARSIGTLGLCLGLAGCADTTAPPEPQIYVVRAHDTLYSIAWRHDLDYRDLARWNHLGADFRISVGQVLTLAPSGTPAGRPVPRAASAPKIVHAPDGPRAPDGVRAPNVAHEPKVGQQEVDPTSAWIWPTERTPPRSVPGGGILLSGRLGQDVRAARAGRVVYAGNGLRGYGNLIIIKHADNLLSAYAHNREMLVREGQEVTAGQPIAHMGEGVPGAPVLYFEIRENGKPVDPLALLPR